MSPNGDLSASCSTALRDGLVNIISLLHMSVRRNFWNMQKWSWRNTLITICCNAWVTNSKLKRSCITLNLCFKDQVGITWRPFWFRKSGKVTNLTAISSNWNSWWRRHRLFKEGSDYTCSNLKPTKSSKSLELTRWKYGPRCKTNSSSNGQKSKLREEQKFI